MRKNKKKKTYDDDDGRSIADMSGVSQAWHTGFTGRHERKPAPQTSHEPLTKKETRGVMANAVLAALAIAAVFIGAMALFILFCQYVWLRG